MGGRKIHGSKGSRRAKPVNMGDNSAFTNRMMGVVGGSQDYSDIKTKCLGAGELFEDPDFPAEDASVFYSRNEIGGFQWKRPHVSGTEEIFINLESIMIA